MSDNLDQWNFLHPTGLHHDIDFLRNLHASHDAIASGNSSSSSRNQSNQISQRPAPPPPTPPQPFLRPLPYGAHTTPARHPFDPRARYTDWLPCASPPSAQPVHGHGTAFGPSPFNPEPCHRRASHQSSHTTQYLTPSDYQLPVFHLPETAPVRSSDYSHLTTEVHPLAEPGGCEEGRSAPATMPPASARKRSAAGSAAERPKRPRVDVEGLDDDDDDDVVLTSDDAIEDLLEKQRQELVRSQRAEGEEVPKSFGQMTCIICMDNLTDITATACGHIFCHECLMQALEASESRGRGPGSCPVCRKPLKRLQKNQIIPLTLMTRKKFQESLRR